MRAFTALSKMIELLISVTIYMVGCCYCILWRMASSTQLQKEKLQDKNSTFRENIRDAFSNSYAVIYTIM